ncbi:MAG: phosphatidylserine decarboxylase [Chlamydiales bacterium]|nr:phosphatidylserine decarboxylase [Chlamydiales bacterium]
MKNPLLYIDRTTGETKQEAIYGESVLRFLYGSAFGRFVAKILSSTPLFSRLYGWWQTLSFTKSKIAPFVKKYAIDSAEFEKPLNAYPSFNAFFTRKLKPGVRPLADGIVLPADGRYLFYQNIAECDGIVVKGKKFELAQLLQDRELADAYQEGSMVLARLCPTDYHRFHFPCDCLPGESRLINGTLYSVNPIALKQRIELLAENKRMMSRLQTEKYGEILFIEIGATAVGTIHQTYIPRRPYKKGDEKGYFSFGGSSIILLFQPGTIQIDPLLLNNSSQNIETLCLFGQALESLFI